MESKTPLHKQTHNQQTNKQTIMHGYFKPRLKPCYLSKQPIHKPQQNINNGKARVDLNGFSSLLSQTEIFHFINKHGQGSVTGGGPKCLHHRLAPPPHAVDELPDPLLRNGIPFLNQNLTQSCQCCFVGDSLPHGLAELIPQMLDGVKVWAACRPLHSRDALSLEKVADQSRSVGSRVVVLQDCVVPHIP